MKTSNYIASSSKSSDSDCINNVQAQPYKTKKQLKTADQKNDNQSPSTSPCKVNRQKVYDKHNSSIHAGRDVGSFKHRKVSKKVYSKWQKIPQPLQTELMTMLNDSMDHFLLGFQNQEQDITFSVIKSRIQQKLKKTKIPKEKVIDASLLRTTQEVLASEVNRLEELEEKFASTLEKETREVECLQAEVDKLKQIALDECNGELHSLLRNISKNKL
ncbi:uncharacterized protein LOC131956825 [Physella acuta]|uniref:uncharacterized protein LOC131956825 n=1 Tax=Physella acuta TaxID=109671 RepID=UPI0027DB753F|nr:uncharacterized protein LOC131956825 [Physella acuta]